MQKKNTAADSSTNCQFVVANVKILSLQLELLWFLVRSLVKPISVRIFIRFKRIFTAATKTSPVQGSCQDNSKAVSSKEAWHLLIPTPVCMPRAIKKRKLCTTQQ